MSPVRWLRLTPALFVLLTACGGGGGPTRRFQVVLGCEGPLEGTRDASGAIVEDDAGLEVGDREAQAPPGPVRAFVSFDISVIPFDATIDFAELQLDMVSVRGAPFDPGPTGLGTLVVEILTYGPSFPSATSYSAIAPTGIQEVVAADATLGVRSAKVTYGVASAHAVGAPRSQYRLRFLNRDQNNDGQDTGVRFVDSENVGNLGAPPVLIVTYTLP